MTNRGETVTDSEECDGSCITRPHTWSPSGARCTVCNLVGTGDPCGDGNCRCECSKEYGPCEEHGETVVQREGASTYTPVELLALYADDATDCGTELSPWALGLIREARTLTDGHRAGLLDELSTLANQVECDLSTLDAPHFTYWDDGFRIVRVLGGCPLIEE